MVGAHLRGAVPPRAAAGPPLRIAACPGGLVDPLPGVSAHVVKPVHARRRGARARMPVSTRQRRAVPDRALAGRFAAVAQALRARGFVAERVRVVAAALEARGRRGALLGVGGRHPLAIGRQAPAGPAAEGLRLVPGQVHRGLVVGRLALRAEGRGPGPAGLAHPAGLVDRAAALAIGERPEAGGGDEAAELADGRLGAGDRETGKGHPVDAGRVGAAARDLAGGDVRGSLRGARGGQGRARGGQAGAGSHRQRRPDDRRPPSRHCPCPSENPGSPSKLHRYSVLIGSMPAATSRASRSMIST